jgi:hypothetical protein
MEGAWHPSMYMPLSTAKVVYSLVQQASADTNPTSAQELYPILEPIWAQGSLANTDSLDLVLPSVVRKTGPRSNKIKQMQKQNTEDTQYKRDTDLRGSPSVGYVHQRNCQVLPLLLSSKMKG